MTDSLDAVLRLVESGRLSAEEALPLIESLQRSGGSSRAARQIRVRVAERGREVVNLRIPLGFAEMATRLVPGLSESHAERIRAAVQAGAIGPLVDIEDEDGDSVLIAME